jgi:predicted Zn-ribbon and HTH transcriptional regulator
VCRQCGWEGFVVIPRRKGFEGSECPECHKPGIDQVEVDP